MNWRYKALLQQVFAITPYAENMNYFFQRHVTKSLPVSDTEFVSIVKSAREHFDVFRRYYKGNIEEASFYEFGAGWECIIPLSFYGFGVQHQTLVDIRTLLRVELINDTIGKFQRLQAQAGVSRKPDKYIDESTKSDYASYLEQWYGIKYLAPCDARDTGLEDNSIDFITSTNTLEHISYNDIQRILKECYRLLTCNGIMIFKIDYQDHYSYFDPHISVYNFLQYSDAAWKLFNPSIHYQNRLRHKDYIDLIETSGFVVVEELQREGTDEDIQTLRELNLYKKFAGKYTVNELAVRGSHLVIRKRDAGGQI